MLRDRPNCEPGVEPVSVAFERLSGDPGQVQQQIYRCLGYSLRGLLPRAFDDGMSLLDDLSTNALHDLFLGETLRKVWLRAKRTRQRPTS